MNKINPTIKKLVNKNFDCFSCADYNNCRFGNGEDFGCADEAADGMQIAFNILFHPAETHVERMWVERDHLRKQIDKLEKFLESDTYKNMNLTQQKIIQYPLSAMREYEHYLNLRYEAERMNPAFNK